MNYFCQCLGRLEKYSVFLWGKNNLLIIALFSKTSLIFNEHDETHPFDYEILSTFFRLDNKNNLNGVAFNQHLHRYLEV